MIIASTQLCKRLIKLLPAAMFLFAATAPLTAVVAQDYPNVDSVSVYGGRPNGVG